MMQVGTLPLPGDDTGLPSELAPRSARVRAALIDLGALLSGSVVAFLGGVAYLLIRTSWGAIDATEFDSALATALLLAVPPTSTAWLLISVAEHRATPGQRRAGLVIARREHGWRAARVLRLALHPLSVPFWLWFVAVLFLLAVPVLPWVALMWCALLAIGGLVSVVLLAIRPGAPAVHDWVARTRVVVRP